MAQQYPKLVNKQYNSPIGLYSDRSVREILERETKVLANGAVGIDFNNPMTNKPANLQNSAVLRMLEEEENRKRSGQPGSLKRVAWPPPANDLEDYVEQEPVHSQGGPLFSAKSVPGTQNNNQAPPPTHPQPPIQIPIQKTPLTPPIQQQQQPIKAPLQQSRKSPSVVINNTSNTFQPILSPSVASSSPYDHSGPLSPSVACKSPVSFTNVAKPWSPQGHSSPQFKPVLPPSLRTINTYQQSYEQHHYQQTSQDRIQEKTAFQQYQTPPPVVAETQRAPDVVKAPREELAQADTRAFDVNQNEPVANFPDFNSSASIEIQTEIPTGIPKPVSESETIADQEKILKIPVRNLPKVLPDSPTTPLLKTVPSEQILTSTKPPSPAAKGLAQNQAPAPQRYQVPVKQVEPPPSTITLRPQAPVSQAPPPLVTSQPATATLRGGKHLRGDLKWPPENVREKMAAEEQHLQELSKGPAVRPRKQCKDYSSFFAKHALTHAYPGYKIPPGTQFYDHNPVM